jgi:Hint domain
MQSNRSSDVETRTTKPSSALTRRNLFAAMSIIAGALGSRAAHAKGDHGHGHGHRHGGGGGGAHCFLRGTLIRTPSGEREISTLQIDDLLVTQSGQEKPIKWIGRRCLHRDAGKPWRADVAPIKVARSALADGLPHRDLYLSPGHALYFDGLLVTVESLVNGSTIVRCSADELRSLEYFNVELAEHEVIFAEGAASETLVPSNEYPLFDNWSGRAARGRDKPAQPIGPEINITGGRLQLRSRLRSTLAPLVDRRTDFDKLRDRIEDRAEWMEFAA